PTSILELPILLRNTLRALPESRDLQAIDRCYERAYGIVMSLTKARSNRIHQGKPIDPKDDIDFDALFEILLMAGKRNTAKLVRFMKDRSIASFQDVMDEAFGKELAEATLRSYANRATEDLRELESRLWFETSEGHVIRPL